MILATLYSTYDVYNIIIATYYYTVLDRILKKTTHSISLKSKVLIIFFLAVLS